MNPVRKMIFKDTKNGDSIEHINEKFKTDRDFVLRAVNSSPRSFEYVYENFNNDRDIVLAAVKHGDNLKYVSEDFKDDKEIVLKALDDKDGHTLDLASENLKNNKDIVLKAVKSSGTNLRYAADQFKKDREIFLEAIKTDINMLMPYHHPDGCIFRDDEEIMLIALSQFGHALEYADTSLQSNRNFILKAVKQGSKVNNHSLLRYCDEKFLSDKEVMVEAIKSDCEAYEFVHPNIKKSKEIVKAVNEH